MAVSYQHAAIAVGIVQLCFGSSTARPVFNSTQDEFAYNYLKMFNFIGFTGRLKQGEELQNLSDEAIAFVEGIRLYQQYNRLTVSGLIDNLTKELMERRRCGNVDIRNIEDLSGDVPSRHKRSENSNVGIDLYQRWREKRFAIGGNKIFPSKTTIKYKFENYPLDQKDSPWRVEKVLREAFDIWENFTIIPFKFQEVKGKEAADITILFYNTQFGSIRPSDGRGGVVGLAYPLGDAQVSGLQFDDSEYWYFGGFGGERTLTYYLKDKKYTSLKLTAIHEIGHILGLGHSREPDALMYFATQTAPLFDRPNVLLHEDDIRAIAYLYSDNGLMAAQPRTTTPSVCNNTGLRIKAVVRHLLPGDDKGDNEDLVETTFVFIGDEYMAISQRVVLEGYPRKIVDDWGSLPADFDYGFAASIFVPDAIAENYTRILGPGKSFVFTTGRDSDGLPTKKVFHHYILNDFVKGDQIWRFANNRRLGLGYPKQLSHIWPLWKTTFTAAFQWSGNSDMYMVEGSNYYRYNYDFQSLVDGYPRPMSNWNGLPEGEKIDAVFTSSDLKTHFIMGDNIYEFSAFHFKVLSVSSFRETWLSCNSYPGNTRSSTSTSQTPIVLTTPATDLPQGEFKGTASLSHNKALHVVIVLLACLLI